jgi:hypothetical protein
MPSSILGLSQFNLLLILLVAMALKISFIKNKKRKTEEQLRRERSSAGADPNRIPGLSFYPTSSNPSSKNQASDSSSQPPSQPQGQDNPGGSSSQALVRTFEFKFSGQRFEMTGITTLGGWFMVLLDDKHATTPNDRRN